MNDHNLHLIKPLFPLNHCPPHLDRSHLQRRNVPLFSKFERSSFLKIITLSEIRVWDQRIWLTIYLCLSAFNDLTENHPYCAVNSNGDAFVVLFSHLLLLHGPQTCVDFQRNCSTMGKVHSSLLFGETQCTILFPLIKCVNYKWLEVVKEKSCNVIVNDFIEKNQQPNDCSNLH